MGTPARLVVFRSPKNSLPAYIFVTVITMLAAVGFCDASAVACTCVTVPRTIIVERAASALAASVVWAKVKEGGASRSVAASSPRVRLCWNAMVQYSIVAD